jgi:uncharacterized membrane protein
MPVMSRRKLLKLVDTEKIKKAIEAAEGRTSGEIRVSVAPYFWGKIKPVAEKAFRRLGMTRTKDRNGILFFIVPSRRRFVVLGDDGIHAKVGQGFWHRVADAMSEKFKSGEFTEGLIKGIETVGENLAAHFPYDAATDKNELPDDVDFGPAKKIQKEK